MTAPKLPCRRNIEAVVIDDAYGTATDEQAAALRHPDNLDGWRLELGRIVRMLDGQLSARRGDPASKVWRIRTVSLRTHLETKLAESKQLIRARDDARHAAEVRLRDAIENHQRAVLAVKPTPDEFDLELWSVLEPVS
jgi:hypothetical protein